MANGSARMPGSVFNLERNTEPIVPIGGWLDRLCPPHHCGEEMDDADADFIRLTDAAEIPASRATWRTPLPATSPCLALSTLDAEIGGRPNRTDAARAAACPRRIRSRRDWRRWDDIMPAKSNSDIPFEAAVSMRSLCKYNPTSHARHVSMIATKSTIERPRRSMLYSNIISTVPERIASSNAVWPGLRSRPFLVVGLSMNALVTIHPRSPATVRRLASCSSADRGQSDDKRA